MRSSRNIAPRCMACGTRKQMAQGNIVRRLRVCARRGVDEVDREEAGGRVS